MTIYIVIVVVKWEELGYTSICGLNQIAKHKNCHGSSDPFPSGTLSQQSTKVCSR
jgi:hypothetical protein